MLVFASLFGLVWFVSDYDYDYGISGVGLFGNKWKDLIVL
jgi:hypothetical protein